MKILIIILIILVVVIFITLTVSMKKTDKVVDDDYSFRNQDGDHVYYDKSIIEKKKFHRLHPKDAVRTFSRLFHRK